MFRFGRSSRVWRPLIGFVVAYAVAAQSLLIALGGFALPARANDSAPAFQLCLHDSQGGSELPASDPDPSQCTQCISCFAGSHCAMIGTASAVFRRVRVEIVNAPRVPDQQRLPRPSAYSIASPRGPPLDA